MRARSSSACRSQQTLVSISAFRRFILPKHPPIRANYSQEYLRRSASSSGVQAIGIAVARSNPARDALHAHWPEYLMEAGALGMFMISACAVSVLLAFPGS